MSDDGAADPGRRPGARAGARRGDRAPVRLRRDVLAYAVAIVASAVVWGLLVFLAIRWGADARAGEGPGWVAFGLVLLAAVACLFGGLMLASRLSRAIGLTGPPPSRHGSHHHH